MDRGIATTLASLLLLAALGALSGPSSFSPIADGPKLVADQAEFSSVIERALQYLRTKGQSDNGAFSPELGPGVTAVVVTGVLGTGRVSPDEPWLARALKYLESFIKPDGGIYEKRHANYITSVALMAFKAANRDGRYDDVIARALEFIKGMQWDERDGISSDDDRYGGFGYDSKGRPDLSNTQFAIEALHSAGIGPDDPAMQKALKFLSLAQNLPSEHNRSAYAARASKDDLGGFIYTPALGGDSKAGRSPSGGLRSYGSMTYAGLKSMIYAGVDRNDQRVQAAIEWIRRHWTVKENPGLGLMGLYYYYHTMAKALAAYGEEQITDNSGGKHAWRIELFRELAGRQQPDGSWVNRVDRWYEGDANLVTGYVLMTLNHIRSSTNLK